jgi:hypothetical protein
MLTECGLLPLESTDETQIGDKGSSYEDPTWQSIEQRRKRDLEAAQLKLGWDAMHDCFDGDDTAALGIYSCFLW